MRFLQIGENRTQDLLILSKNALATAPSSLIRVLLIIDGSSCSSKLYQKAFGKPFNLCLMEVIEIV
jgi:hypothetical protein